MRLHFVVLLVVTAFAIAPLTAQETTRVSSVAEYQYANRLLRVHKYLLNDEERGITVPSTTIDRLKAFLERGDTADDVFKLLTLDKAANDVLANPMLDDWVAYMKLYNQKYPKKQTSLISTLTKHYGDERLAAMIDAAKKAPKIEGKVPEAAIMAKRLEFEQIHLWLGQQKTPKEVFALLKLDDAKVDPFLQPRMVTWAKYVEYFDQANPGTKASLLPAFGHYNEENMVSMLIAAKTVPSTERLAVRIQVELTQLWLRKERTPAYIFPMLKLDQAGDTLLQNPLFFAWMKYTDDFNEMYPKMRVPAITTLKTYKQYTNELLAKMVLEAEKSPSAASIAKQLQAELLENWLKSKKSPSGVFRLLGLNKVGDKAFESPVLEMWLKYVTFFKDTNPTVRVNIADILKKYFTNGVLGNMLLDAVKVPSTKKIATSTLDALTIRWIYDRAQPNEVYTWLRAAHDDVGRKLYNTYEQLYKSKYEFGR